ncbi:hypothetical protein NQ317_015426, partial [Molorchus minor]
MAPYQCTVISAIYRLGNFTRSDILIIRHKRINSENKVVNREITMSRDATQPDELCCFMSCHLFDNNEDDTKVYPLQKYEVYPNATPLFISQYRVLDPLTSSSTTAGAAHAQIFKLLLHKEHFPINEM